MEAPNKANLLVEHFQQMLFQKVVKPVIIRQRKTNTRICAAVLKENS